MKIYYYPSSENNSRLIPIRPRSVFYLDKPVFSFEAGNRHISPAIAIKSPAMNFPSMGFNVQK